MIDTLQVIKEVDELLYQKADLSTATEILEEHLDNIKDGSVLLSVDIPLVTKRLAYCYKDTGETESAYELLREALEVAQNDFNKTEESDILAAMSDLDLRKGDFNSALRNAKKAFRYMGQKRGIRFVKAKVNSINALANVYNYIEDEKKAVLKLHNKAKRVCVESSDTVSLLYTLTYILNYHLNGRGDSFAATKLIGEKLGIEKVKENNILIFPQYLIVEGRLKVIEGKDSMGEELFLEALKFSKEKNLLNDLALCNDALASFYSKKDPKQAGKYFKTAGDIYKQVGWDLKVKELELRVNSLN